jgi:hypothetical protein
MSGSGYLANPEYLDIQPRLKDEHSSDGSLRFLEKLYSPRAKYQHSTT